MPSTGFYPFLQKNISRARVLIKVSMPSTGFYPFLQKTRRTEYDLNAMCQCPQRASIHFYKPKQEKRLQLSECVNALNGLLSISTVASRKP